MGNTNYQNQLFESKNFPEKYDYLAPDDSEIRLLTGFDCGNLCHCTLPAGKISKAVKHKTVNEICMCYQEKVSSGKAMTGKRTFYH